MPKFQYSALKNNNQIVKGELEAANAREVREKIRTMGFIPTKVYTEDFDDQCTETSPQPNVKRIKHISLQDKILFTSELEVLLSSGIPVIEALQTIENNSFKADLRSICSDIRNGIISGMTFAQSLTAMYGNVFGPVYTGLVKTGEQSGELEETLERMLVLLRKQDAVKCKIINASIYPCVLLAILFGVLLLFAKLVFPNFAGIIIDSGNDIPIMAQILMGVCTFVGNFWWLILIMIGAICAVTGFACKNPQIKSKWDEFILKVPVVSDFVRYINLANFMTVLQISYDAGLPIMSGLELSCKTVGNYVIKTQVYNSVNLIRCGKTLTEAFNRTGVIPPALMTMIAAGEKSGTLGKMLKDVAEVIDKKVDMALEAVTKLFEPAVIIVIGGVVLFVAIAFYQMYAGMLGSLF